METIAILDFETNGDAPSQGGRPTEIAIILFRNGRPAERFQSLMSTGARISPFVESLTGITNAMANAAPPASVVMRQARAFVGSHPLAAHNAAFDSKFWDAEMARLGCARAPSQDFACTMLLARRVFPEARDHKLGTLASLLRIPSQGSAHRAMADTEMAMGLLYRIQERLTRRHGLSGAPHALLMSIQLESKNNVAETIQARALELGLRR